MKYRVLLIALLLAAVVLACKIGDPTPSWERSIHATETSAAGEWHAQLTALATGGGER